MRLWCIKVYFSLLNSSSTLSFSIVCDSVMGGVWDECVCEGGMEIFWSWGTECESESSEPTVLDDSSQRMGGLNRLVQYLNDLTTLQRQPVRI